VDGALNGKQEERKKWRIKKSKNNGEGEIKRRIIMRRTKRGFHFLIGSIRSIIRKCCDPE
jgi:hypothetical protein